MVFFQAAVAVVVVGWVKDFDFLRSKKRNPQPTLINSQTKSLQKIGSTEEKANGKNSGPFDSYPSLVYERIF